MPPSVGCVFLSPCGACLCVAGLVLGFSAWLRFVRGVGFVRALIFSAWVFLMRAPLLLSSFYSLSL
jgi:hypothetical protein